LIIVHYLNIIKTNIKYVLIYKIILTFLKFKVVIFIFTNIIINYVKFIFDYLKLNQT